MEKHDFLGSRAYKADELSKSVKDKLSKCGEILLCNTVGFVEELITEHATASDEWHKVNKNLLDGARFKKDFPANK